MIDDLIDFIAALNTTAADRIFDGDAPQSLTDDHICVQKVSGPRALLLDGAENIGRDRYQVDCYSDGRDKKAQVRAMALAVRTALHGFRGLMGSKTVFSIELVNELDLDEIDGDRVLRRVTQDFLVTYPED